MTVNIDSSTGLPKLGEDQRWLVRREKRMLSVPGSWNRLPMDTGNLEVVLQRGVPRVVPAHSNPTGKRRWYGGRVYVVVPASEETFWTDSYIQVMEGKHKIAVFNAACRIMKRINQERAVNELLGAYPPKSIKEE